LKKKPLHDEVARDALYRKKMISGLDTILAEPLTNTVTQIRTALTNALAELDSGDGKEVDVDNSGAGKSRRMADDDEDFDDEKMKTTKRGSFEKGKPGKRTHITFLELSALVRQHPVLMACFLNTRYMGDVEMSEVIQRFRDSLKKFNSTELKQDKILMQELDGIDWRLTARPKACGPGCLLL